MNHTGHTPSLLDSIRRTIEERNLFSARSRINYVSALKKAHCTKSGNRNGNEDFMSPVTAGSSVTTRLARLRNKVIQEIIKSEEMYIQQLTAIRDEFMEDPEIKAGFSKRDFNAIFSNIPVLLEVNHKLLEELKSLPSDNNLILASTKTVAESFLNYAPYLKLYSTYASGFQQGDNLLTTALQQNVHIRELIKQKEEALNNTLQSYLITPIQRIPRYKLLLQQLVGFMGSNISSDPDLQSIIESIKKLDQVAVHMNEMIRQHENSCKLVEIHGWMGKNYHGDLVEPGRYFIKSGVLLKPTTSRPSALNNFYLILLSDQIISCKIKSELGTKGCLQPSLILPLKKCDTCVIKNGHAEVKCEGESLKFTLEDLEDLHEWVSTINETCRSLKKRAATLKKPSSNAKPLKKEQIKDILRNKNRNLKRQIDTIDSPAPTPGKLRKFFNISDRLDEIVEYLSPARSSAKKTSRQSEEIRKENTPMGPGTPDSYVTAIDNADHLKGRAMLMSVSKYPPTTCSIV